MSAPIIPCHCWWPSCHAWGRSWETASLCLECFNYVVISAGSDARKASYGLLWLSKTLNIVYVRACAILCCSSQRMSHVHFKLCLEHFPIYLINEANFFCSPQSSQFLYVHSAQAVSYVPTTLSPLFYFALHKSFSLLSTTDCYWLFLYHCAHFTYSLQSFPFFSLSHMQRITPPPYPYPFHTHTHTQCW